MSKSINKLKDRERETLLYYCGNKKTTNGNVLTCTCSPIWTPWLTYFILTSSWVKSSQMHLLQWATCLLQSTHHTYIYIIYYIYIYIYLFIYIWLCIQNHGSKHSAWCGEYVTT